MKVLTFLAAALASLALSGFALADPARDALLQQLAAEAKAVDSAFAGFAAERGAAFFSAVHKGGGAETPSCTTCHTASPKNTGQTRAGKPIAPMAVSLTPERFTDPEKVAKWFGRNCRSVLGRECTVLEKGDFITFMMSQ